MIDIDTRLTIKHDVASVFTDFTADSVDMLRDEYSITIAAADKLLIGFRKPINAVYMAFKTANTNTGTVTLSYNKKGSGFTAIEEYSDETKGYTRNGFLTWDRNLEDEEETTIDGDEKFWYQLEIDSDTSAMEIYGINLVFCDDNDLQDRVPYILNNKFLFNNRTDHLNACVAARNEIIQEMRDRQLIKRSDPNAVLETTDQWDMLHIPQLRETATWYALHVIFDNASDEDGDVFDLKAAKYENRYLKRVRDLIVDFDKDDDGERDEGERQTTIKPSRMSR